MATPKMRREWTVTVEVWEDNVRITSVAAAMGNGMRYAVRHKPTELPKWRKTIAYSGLRLVKRGASIPAVRKSDRQRDFHLKMHHAYTMMPKKPRVSQKRNDGLSIGQCVSGGKKWPASIT